MVGSSWRPWRTLLRTLSLPLVLGLAGCGTLPQTLFGPVGEVARTQMDLLNLTIWIVSGIFVVVAGLLLYVLIRFRARAGAPTPKEVHGNHTLEVLWTVIPIVILITMGVPTVKDAFHLAVPPTKDVINVKVIGHQWWWEFQYPDLGITTANELHMPVGKTISLTLTSADVIHSFWIPRIAGKTDVVPNRTNTMWFNVDADKAGVYYGQCAEFCGDSHANMRARAVAQSPEDFDAWVKQMRAGAVKPAAGNSLAVTGETLFMGGNRAGGGAMPCYTCHAIAGSKAEGKVGPNLTLFGQRTIVAAGTLDNTPENLAKWLHDPQSVKPGALMPNLNLTQDELNALVAYLHSQK